MKKKKTIRDRMIQINGPKIPCSLHFIICVCATAHRKLCNLVSFLSVNFCQIVPHIFEPKKLSDELKPTNYDVNSPLNISLAPSLPLFLLN